MVKRFGFKYKWLYWNRTPKNYVKQQEWDMAIGFQEVDNLKPYKYLEKLFMKLNMN